MMEKLTLFNCITKVGDEWVNYPFFTIESNIGLVSIPDKRIEKLTKLYNSE